MCNTISELYSETHCSKIFATQLTNTVLTLIYACNVLCVFVGSIYTNTHGLKHVLFHYCVLYISVEG